MSVEVKEGERNDRVSYEDFILGYKKGCEDGLTNEEIADSMDMVPSSCNSRASQERKKCKLLGFALPYPKGGTGNGSSKEDKRKKTVSFLSNLLQEIDATDKKEKTDDKTKS